MKLLQAKDSDQLDFFLMALSFLIYVFVGVNLYHIMYYLFHDSEHSIFNMLLLKNLIFDTKGLLNIILLLFLTLMFRFCSYLQIVLHGRLKSSAGVKYNFNFANKFILCATLWFLHVHVFPLH